MAKKRAPHSSSRLASQSEAQGSFFPTRELLENDWLAPAGSEQEKQLLRQWARHGGLSQNQLQLVHEWLNNPDGFATRNKISRQTAKEGILGPVAYRTAMERHQRLNKKEWLVAYFTAAGMRQQEIARLTRRSPRTVDNIIRDIKDKITQELEADIESVELTQIARWFFGL